HAPAAPAGQPDAQPIPTATRRCPSPKATRVSFSTATRAATPRTSSQRLDSPCGTSSTSPPPAATTPPPSTTTSTNTATSSSKSYASPASSSGNAAPTATAAGNGNSAIPAESSTGSPKSSRPSRTATPSSSSKARKTLTGSPLRAIPPPATPTVPANGGPNTTRSEEHTSELQSRE